jgi:hypothetical protein
MTKGGLSKQKSRIGATAKGKGMMGTTNFRDGGNRDKKNIYSSDTLKLLKPE